ncbi:alpha carbonic anhydrase 7-like [Impatiens glandulifera]|uniref:alpha carbonic anhydrase 7-like n=1 Tax=Impatiens glandulifera TaxID=253017 RepID=UPI001FB09566|nr:alpha carbonic anhydrase 7-like [Impatiens glandulifera]
MKNSWILFISLIFLFLFSRVASNTEEGGGLEEEDEKEFDYDWRSKKGPSRWGLLKREWKACNNGEMQSPIDMSDRKVKLLQKGSTDFISRIDYKSANATLKNRGHDISLQWVIGEAGSIEINGTKFFLHQAHWHSPSEHSINGRRYDMELHMVHVNTNITFNKNNHIAVIGVLYQIGHADHFLFQLMKNISKISDKKVENFIGLVNPKRILKLKRNTKFYRYMGSLTVPPCTEGVIWTITKNVRSVSTAQVQLLREAVQDHAERNARPVQPLNNRNIYSSSNLHNLYTKN